MNAILESNLAPHLASLDQSLPREEKKQVRTGLRSNSRTFFIISMIHYTLLSGPFVLYLNMLYTVPGYLRVSIVKLLSFSSFHVSYRFTQEMMPLKTVIRIKV